MRHRVRLLVCAGCIVAFMSAPGGHAAVPSFFQGSVYEYVPTYTTWDRARAEAETMSFMGFPGRLATITSAAENAFIASLVPVGGNTMLGGSDAQTEGTWLWETGPEAGTIFWKDGAPFGSAYVNWRPGEPNNVQPFEDYLVMSNGQWNDSDANSFLHSGYVVEYRLTASGFDFGMTNGQAIFYCPHTADADCPCRKPKPGMFRRISETFNADLKGVPAIGDSLRDLQACATLGCRPMLVITGKGEKTRTEGNLPEGTLDFVDLSAAVDHILAVKKK